MNFKKTALLITALASMVSMAGCTELEEDSSVASADEPSSVVADSPEEENSSKAEDSSEESSSDPEPEVKEYTMAFYVTDDSGEAVSAAIVTIGGTSVETDDLGACEASFEDGEYSFTVSCEGYEDYESSFVVEGSDGYVNVQLTAVNESEGIYKELLDMYYDAVANGWPNAPEEWYPDSSPYGDATYIWRYEIDRGLSEVGYQFIDLNGDGIDELIVSPIYDSEYIQSQSMIYDMYTCIDGEIISLVASGERYSYYLCKDNTLMNNFSNSAFTSGHISYSVGNKASLEVNEVYLYDDWTDEENPWFYATGEELPSADYFDGSMMQHITKEEFYDGIDKYEYKPLELTPLSEYSR